MTLSRPIFFVDMDGVLCDFIGDFARLMKRDLNSIPPIYDLAEAFGMTTNEVNAAVQSRYFWTGMTPLPWAFELIRALDRQGEVYIASSPWPNLYDNLAMKAQWCARYLTIPPSRVFLNPNKHLLAGPNRWLIDDLPGNVEKFIEFGGRGVLIPARHNFIHVSNFGCNSITEYVLKTINHNHVIHERN